VSLDALFDDFRETAFRYEGLPAYSVPDEVERIQAWREHRPRPERSVRTNDWLRRIAVTTAQGKRWSRVRAVDWPLPEYLRYELTGYGENQAVGDETLMVDREHAGDVGDGLPDFWLFDAGTGWARAALLHYTDEGAFLGVDMVTDPGALASLEVARRRLVEHAVPLNEWLATQQGSRVA
jgi:hypothetical protein